MDDLERSFECSICLSIWNDPKTLPCSHVFCKGCLSPLIMRDMITCPECRSGHVIPYRGLDNDAWSTQRILTNLADSMRNRDSSSEYHSFVGTNLSSGRVDPRRSFVETKGAKVKLGSKYLMFVKLRDGSGNSMDASSVVSQLRGFVDLKPRPPGFQKIVMSARTLNGECYFMYPTTQCGRHEFSVVLGNEPIKDMPLEVVVQPKGVLGCEIKGPLRGPRDVICHEGNFLVTDGIEKAVFLIDHGGRELKKLKIQRNMQGDFAPMGISSYAGKVFVTDMGNRCIHRYDNLDGFPTQFGPPHLQKPTGIVVSPDNGSIFVVDNAKKNVTIFDQDGNFTKVIDYLSHRKDDAFKNPQMVAINSIGDRLFVADQDDEGKNSIKVINVFESKLEKKIPVKFSSYQAKPYGIAIGRDDALYITAQVVHPDEDKEKGRGQRKGPKDRIAGGDQKKLQKSLPNGIVLVYDSTGYYIGAFGTLPYQLDRPGGLVVVEDEDRSLLAFVVDSPGRFKNGALKRFIV